MVLFGAKTRERNAHDACSIALCLLIKGLPSRLRDYNWVWSSA